MLVQDEGLQPALDAGWDIVGHGQLHHVTRGLCGDPGVGVGVRLVGMTGSGRLFGGGHRQRGKLRYLAVQPKFAKTLALKCFVYLHSYMLLPRVRGAKFKLARLKSRYSLRNQSVRCDAPPDHEFFMRIGQVRLSSGKALQTLRKIKIN